MEVNEWNAFLDSYDELKKKNTILEGLCEQLLREVEDSIDNEVYVNYLTKYNEVTKCHE